MHTMALTEEFNPNSKSLSLITLKSKGRLNFPSVDVMDICVTSEKWFREKISATSSYLSQKECFTVVNCVLSSYLNKSIFVSLYEHMLECDPLENHTWLSGL
jgi:hypothetical protein